MRKYRSTPKLTEKQVEEIRRRAAEGEKGKDLAEKFSISRGAVSLILRGLTWPDVPGPLKRVRPRTQTDTKRERVELWRPVPGYENLYSASNLGNIRIEVTRHNIRAGTHLRQTRDRDGYLTVTLTDTKSPRACRVSLLVLAAFVGPRPAGLETNHKDGDRQNNALSNLEYVTKAENIKHAVEVLGSDRKGINNPSAKLGEPEVLELRRRAATGEPYTTLGKAFGITSVMARKIATGECWEHVGGPRTTKRKLGRPPQRHP